MGDSIKTIALRFAENFAPDIGTIRAHQEIIDHYGFVWYGKLGNPISQKTAAEIFEQSEPRILLIHSGGPDRYWFYIDSIQREAPDRIYIPSYYRDIAEDFKCWFRVNRIEKAHKQVMSHCTVRSSGKKLTYASQHSMSPYFIIDYDNS